MIFFAILLLIVLAAVIASAKNRNPFLWAILSLFPLFFIILLFLPKLEDEKNEIAKKQLELQQMQMEINIKEGQKAQGETIECPSCAEIIKAKAKICRFCNHDLSLNES